MLGAGFVTKPTLDVLSDSDIYVSVGKFFDNYTGLGIMFVANTMKLAEPSRVRRTFPRVSRMLIPFPWM